MKKSPSIKHLIIGIDEVGRGALAGPVVASAVAIEEIIPGVKDSKMLNIKQREELASKIEESALAVAIEFIPPKIIDKIGILNATLLAMKNALINCIDYLNEEKISADEISVFIDGLHIFKIEPGIISNKAKINLIALPRADKFIYQVSCASIYAKHNRDVFMQTIEHGGESPPFGTRFPDYDFKRNLGYPTKEHIKKIKELGPCEIHRKSFLKNLFYQQSDLFEK